MLIDIYIYIYNRYSRHLGVLFRFKTFIAILFISISCLVPHLVGLEPRVMGCKYDRLLYLQREVGLFEGLQKL